MTERSLSTVREEEVRRAAAAGGKLAALVRIRELTGASLAEALAIAQAMWPPSPEQKRAIDVDLEIVVVGPFATSLVEHLGYSPERYQNVHPGTPVIANIGSTLSDEGVLAWMRLLGVDPWDFNTHCVDLSRLDLDREHHPLLEDEWSPFEALRAFRDAGFTLYVYPRTAPSIVG